MVRVLLLNATSEPLAVVNRRHALSLMLRGCVEAASQETTDMRSISETLKIPSVLRLRYYVNAPRRDARWSKKAVLRRDQYTCAYCSARPGDQQNGETLTARDFTVDHILPVSRGGKDTWSNTICACFACNQRKADRLPREINMKLGWEPKRPRTTYLVLSGDIPSAWRTYIDVRRPFHRQNGKSDRS
jgi:5-methylcytosine-specific restriction endonuclease McrA